MTDNNNIDGLEREERMWRRKRKKNKSTKSNFLERKKAVISVKVSQRPEFGKKKEHLYTVG